MLKTINGGKLPTRGTKYSACVDLYANEDVIIGAGETKVFGLGVAIDLDYLYMNFNKGQIIPQSIDWREKAWERFQLSHYLQLALRSSLGKKGLILPNGVGIIDLDYPDEIKMIVHNPINYSTHTINHDISSYGANDTKKYHIKKGDKIAQITLLEHKSYLFGIDTDVERDGGIGSTDEQKMKKEQDNGIQ